MGERGASGGDPPVVNNHSRQVESDPGVATLEFLCEPPGGGCGEIVEYAFGEAGLHRLEAGTLVDNVASQRVLEKNVFERFGLARRYLLIAGEWRDHVLFERVAN